MEDLMDDDFGDLYEGLENQASANLCAQSLGNEHDHTDKEEEESLASGSKEFKDSSNGEKLGNSDEDDGEESDDSEDDLNIVLNDENCKGFSVNNINGNGGGVGYEKDEEEREGADGGVNNGVESTAANGSGNGAECGGYILQHLQNKNLRSYRSAFPTNQKGNEYAGVVSHSSNAVRDDCDDTGCMQHKASNLGRVAKFRATANSAVLRGEYPFSLPWYRTILDVNIDAFEDKRWRHPGVDISDFFNFGFNEDSWKQYCISLEQFQQQSYINSKLPIHQSPKLTQAYEIRSQYNCVAQGAAANDVLQVGSSSKCPDSDEKQLVLPKGQAIQVEDGTGERQPTMDLECPLVWDSDVVIQINVQDSNENSAHSSEEKVGHEDDSAHRASESRNLNVDDIRDACYSGSAGGCELSAEFLEGNLRCSKVILECDKMSHDPDNETNQFSDADGCCHEKENAHSAEDLAEAMEIGKVVEEEIGRNTCKIDQFLNEPELSLGDHSCFSPGLFFSGSDSEASGDTVAHFLKESPSALSRPSSVPGLQESVMSDHKSSKSNGIIGKSGIQNCSRHKSPIWERQKHQNGRLHGVAGRRIHRDDDSDAPIIRKGHSPHGHSRSIEKLHDSDYESGDDFSYDRRKDSSRDHSGERFGKDQAVYRTKYHRKYHWRFRDEMKPKNRSGWNGRKHLYGRSSRKDNRDIRRDSFRFRRGHSPEDTIPTYSKSRRLISKYNNYKKMHFPRRRNCKNIQFGKRTFRGRYFLNHKNGGDLMREKCGRSVSFANRKRFPLDEKCGRQSLFDGREVNLSGRRVSVGDDPHRDLDNSSYKEIEDEYQNPHHHHFSSRSQQESYASDEVRWQDMMPSRSDMLNSRSNERYGTHRRQTGEGEDRDGCWVGSCNDTADGDDIVYPDDQVPLQRYYSWQSGVLHWTQDESILRHLGGECYVERKSCSYGVASSNERIHTKHRAANGEALVDDIQLKRHNYKWIREESSAKYVSRSPTLMHEGSDEKEVGRCSDPVDVIFGEGKSSERCSNGGSLIREGKCDRMDIKFLEEQKNSHIRKATLANFPKTEDGDENCLDKFQVTEHNKESDVEDGQIIAEESKMERNLEKKRASETAVLTRDMKKRNFHTDNASSGNEKGREYDNQLLLDVIAKMEKRRERFKDPVVAEKGPDKTPNPQVDLTVDTVQTNQQRRPRKRRWGGS